MNTLINLAGIAALALIFANAHAEQIGNTSGSPVRMVPVQQPFNPPASNNGADNRTMLQFMDALMKQTAETNKYSGYEPNQKPDNSMSNWWGNSFGTSNYEQTARECGEDAQRKCSPSNFGGRTMCGRSVAMMLKCMAGPVGANPMACTGACGNGKDFVNCEQTNQMEKCGYGKLAANDPRCRQAGAVLAYTQSPTARGQMYGHVEFLCGTDRYCSVYSGPNDKPWPRPTPDACWYPRGGGGGSAAGGAPNLDRVGGN